MGDRIDAFPRSEHVEHHAVDTVLLQFQGPLLEITDYALPLGRYFGIKNRDICTGNLRKFFATLNGHQGTLFTDCSENRQRQSARADTCFEHVMTRSDISDRDDMGCVFRVNNGCSTRHRENKIT